MTPKLFITGATGYIGGNTLTAIIEEHPDWDYTCLVRNSDKGAQIAAVFPQVKLVYGDLSSVQLIEEEASKADIVFHLANADDEPSARAIAAGLSRRTEINPAFWIHVSGSLILGWETIERNCYGERTSHVYNDWEGVQELISLPDSAAHRNVDKIVLAASKANPEKVKTAIVCPPIIYGTGNSKIGNNRSMQVPGSANTFMKEQKAFMVGKGENIWHQVFISDLAQLFLLLGEAALTGGAPATWGDQGYYLAESGPVVWGELLQAIAKEAVRQGVLKSSEVASLTVEETEELMPYGKLMIGTNSRGISMRARKLLGWKTKGPVLLDTLPETVEQEARSLGLIQSHAEKVEQEST